MGVRGKRNIQTQKTSEQAEGKGHYRDTDIAVIGLACRFPEANNYLEFADNLLKGVNSIKEIPPSRWDINTYYSPNFDEPNKSISKWCGLIDNIDQFDNQFFHISPREANNMDPQQRLLLEETWHCIEDSGVSLSRLQQKSTSVYVGVMATDYKQEASSPDVITDSYACLGNYECMLSNRVSYMFDLQGASLSIDAACASSLVAIHEAKRTLILRESDYSLASGVSLNFHPWKYISFSKSRMLSPDGQCKTFDIEANGYVPGEGVGVILLQRLEDAVADGNHIYGIIKGSAISHGGRTSSITAPRVEAQRDVILSAYKNAGISPDSINYVEAHGTGTSLGDPIEVEALTKAFREYTQENQICKIGSAKTNIGHLEAAAGIAGVIKILMMMRRQKIPQSLNIKKLNPIINFKNSPFMVATELTDWQQKEPKLPRRASVSSFGFGGVNSHLVLEEFCQKPVTQDSESEVNQLFILSAKSSNSINKLIEDWRQFVNSHTFSQYSLKDICTTLKLGRGSFPYRYGAHVHSSEELKKLLKAAASSIPKQNKKNWCLRIGDISFESLAQFQAYLERFELFKQNLEKVKKSLLALFKPKKDLLKDFHQGSWTESNKPLYSFMVAYAGICTLMDLGYKPDVIAGEKAGVLVGLVLSGIMKLEDAFAVLNNQKQLKKIEFTRPKIPYYDSILKTTVMPFHFDETYLRLLVDELGRQNKLLGQILVDGILYTKKKDAQPAQDNQQHTLLGQLLIRNGVINKKQLNDALKEQKKTHNLLGAIIVREKYCTPDELTDSLHQQDILRYYVEEVLRHYVDKARLLNASQFTFKKFLEEWNIVLKRSGRDFLQLLYDDQLLSQKGERLRNEKLLMMIIIISCLRRLNQKWDLTEQQMIDEKRFYELVDLVTDELMTKEDLVDLLLGDNPDYASIAHTLNKQQVNRNLNNSYRYIKKLNPNIREIEDVSSWLINAVEINNVLPEDSMAYLPIDNIAFFEIGQFNEPVPFKGSVYLKMGQDFCKLFTNSLLELWLHGVDIKWQKLYEEGSYKKVVLPVYPFNRKSFWLRKKDPGQPFQSSSELQQIDQEGLRYKRNFSIQDPIIQAHVITGKSIIPGASLIELGLEAAQKSSNQTINTLQNIIIQSPGIVEKDLTLEVEIGLEEKRFIVKSDVDTLCSTQYETIVGKSFPALDLSLYAKNQLDSKDNSRNSNVDGLYHLLSNVGYQYGKELQVIKSFWKDESGFFFELKKPSQDEGLITGLNPRILDGVFQAALAAGYLEKQLSEDHTLYVPYFIKSFHISGQISDHCFVYINQQDIQKKGQDLKAQLKVYDLAGKAVWLIEDMLFKRVSNQFLTQGPQSPSPKTEVKDFKTRQVYYYRPTWIKQSLNNSNYQTDQCTHHRPDRRIAILFVDNDNLSEQLSKEAALQYQKVFFVEKGAAFINKGYSRLEINPDQEHDYLDVIQHIASQDIAGQINNKSVQYDIYHLWAYKAQAISVNHLQDLSDKQEKGVKSLFFLAKALSRAHLKHTSNIIVGTHNIHVVEPMDSGEGYGFGSLLGLAKTIMIENPKIKIKLVDFGEDNLSWPPKARLLLDEELSSESTKIVAYRQEGRYVRAFKPCSFSENQKNQPKPILKDGGVYLLIGGAGGIGMKVAEMITKQVKAMLVFLGRSALSSEKRHRMEQLQAYGSKIIYIQGDVTNAEHMEKLIKIIKARHGNINGVIQTGGILEDKLLISKDWESFQRVAAPKVYGTWIINQLTRTEPLDFFVVFSSVVSLFGNIGQADYAAANSFLDSFIQYRTQNNYPGKSIGINWTLWADGGMGLNEQIKMNFESRGLPSISSAHGLKALAYIMRNEQPGQLAVLGEKIKDFESI